MFDREDICYLTVVSFLSTPLFGYRRHPDQLAALVDSPSRGEWLEMS